MQQPTFDSIIETCRRDLAALAGKRLVEGFTLHMVAGVGQAAQPTAAATNAPRRRRRRAAGNSWATDARARRVPNWLIAQTGGLDTKAKIVAKYGRGVTFKLGAAMPAVLSAKQRAHLQPQQQAVQ